MIYILDDSILINKRSESISYLRSTPYCGVCSVIEKPTLEDLRRIFTNTSWERDLLCLHKSLKIFNEKLQPYDNSITLVDNFKKQVKNKGVKCIIFSRDVTTNEETLYIDKDVFYSNFHCFIDDYINNDSRINFSKLFYGSDSEKNTRLNLFRSICEQLYDYDEKKENILKDLLRKYNLDEKEVQNIINSLSDISARKQIKNYLESLV